MADHVHMCIVIPPKHAVASVIGFLKGKSAIAIARMQVLRETSQEKASGREGMQYRGGIQRRATKSIHKRARRPGRRRTLLKLVYASRVSDVKEQIGKGDRL